MDTVFLKRR